MALAKISLKLGRKTIELTPEQFEELKQDMRDLDKSHHYYWHTSPWYQPWYDRPNRLPTFTYTTPVVYGSSCDAAISANSLISQTSNAVPEPPAFSGSILSAT